MAFIQMSLFSKSLMRTVHVNVILPVDKLLDPSKPEREDKPYKTLYLLHGIFGNNMDWGTTTRVQRFAEEHDLVVVMPSGENAFYVDQPGMHNYYGKFIGEELVEMTRKMFPLSTKREDTFIGGLSMGGFGALRNGLKYADTFGYIVSLSGAIHFENYPDWDTESHWYFGTRAFLENVFGPMEKFAESDNNPKYLVKKLVEEGKAVPKFFIACGDEDELLTCNKEMNEYLKELGVDVYFEIGKGNHEWDFWDTYIKKAIEWLPTEDKVLGISSGNIGK